MDTIDYVYDIETFQNYFLYCAVSDKNNWHIYSIGNGTNDLNKLLDHLDHPGLKQIGFNNIRFDAQILQYLMTNRHEFTNMIDEDRVAEHLYAYAQQLINNQENFPPYREYQLYIPQVDCFKIMHFDNNARRTSLKALQVAMKWHNVQDMPIHHTTLVKQDQHQTIIGYCKNDVLSTREFYRKINQECELRTNLTNTWGINCTNMSDSSIGEKLFAKLYCDVAKIKWSQIKDLRTPRNGIPLNDIILPYIKFATPELQQLLNSFQKTVVYDTYSGIKASAPVGNLISDYGTGGIHACIRPGIYTNETQIIHDIDVSSFYPNLAIVNNWRPEHLGQEFAKAYSSIYETRKTIPKKDPRNKAYKLMLNSVYGKSNSQYSYLYDPQFTMQITINGQLLITMLAERLSEKCTILQINTDGVTVQYDKQHTGWVKTTCDKWQRITKLELEDIYYQKFVVRDVNNYIAQTTDGSIKNKGCFVYETEWHQNPSSPVIAKALECYFIHGISPEKFVEAHPDMWDFQMRQRFRAGDTGFQQTLMGEVDVGKTVRYYLSTDGRPLLKRAYLKGVTARVSFIHNAKPITITNQYDGSALYNLDRNWYINETYKIISQITPNIKATGEQLTMF